MCLCLCVCLCMCVCVCVCMKCIYIQGVEDMALEAHGEEAAGEGGRQGPYLTLLSCSNA
jgi:hypothetical protein